jgi:hypothetical protein
MEHPGRHDDGGPIMQQGPGGGSSHGCSCRANTCASSPLCQFLHVWKIALVNDTAFTQKAQHQTAQVSCVLDCCGRPR